MMRGLPLRIYIHSDKYVSLFAEHHYSMLSLPSVTPPWQIMSNLLFTSILRLPVLDSDTAVIEFEPEFPS